MALGDQSKALIIMSKMKGWDPTLIPGVGSIANWDKAPNPWELGDQSVGNLPEGTPDGFPKAEEPRYDERVSWSAPDVGRETKDRSGNGDPYAGMGGM